MINRRAFIGTMAGGLLAAPLVVEAQQAGKVPRIGMLWLGSREAVQPFISMYEQSLRQLGYSVGRTLHRGNSGTFYRRESYFSLLFRSLSAWLPP